MRKIIALFGLVLLVACNPLANMEQGEKKVAEFQKLFNAGKYERLYDDAAPEFHEVVTREAFDDLMFVLSSRLGAVQSSERTGFNVNTNNGVTRTVITMDTMFEKGEGQETFTFTGHGEDILLITYDVSSEQLALTREDIAGE